jgi:ribosomal protein S18 acetylase RimI-like enzyme
LVRAVHHLLPQLSGSARLPSGLEIDEIVASRATTLLLASDDGSGTEGHVGGGAEQGARSPEAQAGAQERRAYEADEGAGPGSPIVGMLTLVTFRLPTGVRAWIEDVVVDGGSRGRGVGEALTLAALEIAADRGAQTVDLTSRPSREAANRLYRRMGFEPRETNVYRFPLPS